MMEPNDYVAIQELLRPYLSPKRFQHSMGVADLAEYWAVLWQEDKKRAYIAGILHDIAREMSDEELIQRARQYGIPLDEEVLGNPILLHAPVGAMMVKEELNIDDPIIYDAIIHHSIPTVSMSNIAKIVFLADICEPNRRWWPEKELLKDLSLDDLDQAMVFGLNQSLEYLIKNNKKPHPRTVEVLEEYKKLVKSK